MRIVAFAGPSLLPSDRDSFPGVEWRPPAEAGDLLELCANREATAVCLIDGYFDHRPAARHKEILLLLARGIPILGASSIGALRAAEMDRLGMVGVGRIYRAYADGRLTGDDEVALVHGPREWDWRALSVPLVDARATLCRALRERVLSHPEARAVLLAAAQVHYVERSWDTLLDGAPLPAAKLQRMKAWLRAGEVSQKRIDARACIAAALAGGIVVRPRPAMVRTYFLDALARERGVAVDPATGALARAGA